MSEHWWARFSLGRVLFWIVVSVLAYLYGWLASVAFVSACSLYANIASDFASWRADRNPELRKRLADIERKLDALIGEDA